MNNDYLNRFRERHQGPAVQVRRALDPVTNLPVPPLPTKPPGLIDKLKLVMAIKKLWSAINAERTMKKLSWKTTVGGVITALAPVLLAQENAVLHAIGQICASVGPLIVGVSARDVNVTSEQAGAK